MDSTIIPIIWMVIRAGLQCSSFYERYTMAPVSYFLNQTAIIGYIITFLLEIVESMGNLYKNVNFIIFHTGNLIGWSIIYRFWYFFLSRIHKIHDLFPKKASKQQWTLNFYFYRFFSPQCILKMRGDLYKMSEILSPC